MLIFQNPDRQWYFKTISHWIRGKNPTGKYTYILEESLVEETVSILLSSNKNGPLITRQFYRFLRFLRFYLWLKINNLPLKKFKLFFDCSSFTSQDIVFSFAHDNLAKIPVDCDEDAYLNDLKNSKANFLIHLSHYVYSIETLSKRAKSLNKIFFIAEANLQKHSSFFKKFFSWYSEEFFVLPFCPQKRFVDLEGERSKLALAIGAITFEINEQAFIEHFHTNILQPSRELILKNKKEFRDLDVIINKLPSRFEHKGALSHISSRFINHLKSMVKGNEEKRYYSLDIVELYNSYKYFLCPPELGELPGIGMSEGMASGSIFITERSAFLEDYGMVAGRDYLEYDGTLEGLSRLLDECHEKEVDTELYLNSKNIAFNNFCQEKCLQLLREIIVRIK